MMDMIQGGNRMVFVLEGTVENFSCILIEGIIPHCGRVEEGKSIWSGAFF